MTHWYCSVCGKEYPIGELTIPFDGRPDGAPFCSGCFLGAWRRELLLLFLVGRSPLARYRQRIGVLLDLRERAEEKGQFLDEDIELDFMAELDTLWWSEMSREDREAYDRGRS